MSTKVLVELILTFRRINSYLTGFGQRFIGTLAHIQIFKSGNHTRPFNKLRNKHKEHSSFLPRTCPFLLLTSYFILHTFSSNAQLLTPLSNEMNRRVEYEMIQNGTPFFTVMKPYVITPTPKSPEGDFGEPMDSLHHLQIDSSSNLQISSHLQINTFSNLQIKKTWFHRKLFHESLIQVDSGSFYLFADPVFEFGVGRETSGRNTYINTRGLRAGGRLGKYVAFGTEFYENQGIFNSAVSYQVKKTSIFPAHGIARKYDSTGYDFSYSSAYLSVTLMQKLNIRLAQGRQFIGDGYRSLLLSDASYAYPYLKFTWQNNAFLYSWDHLLLQDLGVRLASNRAPFRRKSATIHSAAINIKNKIQLSLIKIQLYNNPDTFGNYTLNFSQLNPILIPGNTDKNTHSMWGLNIKINPLRKLVLYNQWNIDNLFSDSKNHIAFQAGAKYYGSLGNHTFYIQAEYNQVPPLTYTSNYKIYNWKHNTEALAHPYGRNFKEFVFIGTWNYKSWQLSGQINIARQFEPLSESNPLSWTNVTLYANDKKLNWYKAELTYYFNQKTLMNVSVGYNYRKELLSTGNNTMNYIYFSFGTRLFNKYYDF